LSGCRAKHFQPVEHYASLRSPGLPDMLARSALNRTRHVLPPIGSAKTGMNSPRPSFVSSQRSKRLIREVRIMMRRIIGAIGAVAALPIIHLSAMAASVKPVDRALADQLTRQFNQQELEQMQSGVGSYSQARGDQLNRQQLGSPGTPLPSPEISRTVMPPRE